MEPIQLNMSAEALEEIAQKLLQNKMNLSEMHKMMKKEDSAFRRVLPIKKRFHPSIYSDVEYNRELVINEHDMTKKLKLTHKEIAIAAYNTVQLKLHDNAVCVNPRILKSGRYDEITSHLNTCRTPYCELCLMGKITDDPRRSFNMLNHVMRCIDANCESKECFVIKNLMKYNLIQTDLKAGEPVIDNIGDMQEKVPGLKVVKVKVII
jgi:hypothetical protein